MRLIDADRLLQRTKFYNLKNGNRAIDEIDILHAPTVEAIPLDEVKQARDEISKLHITNIAEGFGDYVGYIDSDMVFKILDKLIAESEG